MHINIIAALAALAAGVSAQSTSVPESVRQSVLNVLVTALPPSALSVAVSNQASFESEVMSSLAAGKTPDWYQALPTDVKSLLSQIYPANTASASTPAATSAATSAAIIPTGSFSGGNTTSVTTVSSAVLTSGGGASSHAPSSAVSSGGASSRASSSAVSTGGAPYPTAVIGAGLAGAAGFVAMLAL